MISDLRTGILLNKITATELIQTLLASRSGPLYKMMEYQLGTLDQNGEMIGTSFSNKFLGLTCTMFPGMSSNEDSNRDK